MFSSENDYGTQFTLVPTLNVFVLLAIEFLDING